MSNQFDDFDDAPAGRGGGGPVEPHRGVLILVLGILSLVACGLLGIPAWLMGKSDLEKIRRGRMDKDGETLTKVGYILGIVGTVLTLLGIVLGCLFFALGMAATGAKR